jgi:site-specific DNA recombinase
VRVFFYLEDRERTLDTAMDKVMPSLTNFAAEMEREKARQRTYDAMVRKAKALQVTGGKVYGYDNVDVLSPAPSPDGRPRRVHVIRAVNGAQAEIVRRIFTMYAAGLGLKKIASALNAEHVPPPRGDRAGWAPSAIREMLRRELYRGVIVWNRSQKISRGGTRKQRKRPEGEWLRLEAPELRIVAEDLWRGVQARLDHHARSIPRSRTGGRLLGRPAQADLESKHLLSGLGRCTECGGPLIAITRAHGMEASGRFRVGFYACGHNYRRGSAICANNVQVREEVLDHAILQAINDVLDERILEAAVERALERLRSGQERHLDRRTAIERELSLIEAQERRFVDAIKRGGDLDSLVACLKAEDGRKKALASWRPSATSRSWPGWTPRASVEI